jgi:hypothetical protein
MRAAEKVFSSRHVLHYCREKGKKSLLATTNSMRPGLTHLAIRCLLPASMKAKRRTPLGKAVVRHIPNVLFCPEETRTQQELVLDLRDIEQYWRPFVLEEMCYFNSNYAFPHLSCVVVRGELRDADASGLFGVLRRAPRIRDFHIETCWGSVAYSSDSGSATVVVDKDFDHTNVIHFENGEGALITLLRAKEELSSLHLIVKAGLSVELDRDLVNEMPSRCKVVLNFHIATDEDDALGWLGNRDVRVNFHSHRCPDGSVQGVHKASLNYVHISNDYRDDELYTGFVHLDKKEPWTRHFVEEAERLEVGVVWLEELRE